MIISRKRYQAEIDKRVEEALRKAHEEFWRDDRERERERHMYELEQRLIAVEKKSGIDHPSHHDNCVRPI
jgi:hypothetical protein